MIELNKYDLIIVNSSGGKDSIAALFEVVRLAELQEFDRNNIVVSHQDLKNIEWKGTRELVIEQSNHFGLRLEFSTYRNMNGVESTLLDYVERRGKWPSNKQRYCTSDFKRGPGSRVVRKLTKDMGKCRILHVFGFRKSESPARKKKRTLVKNKVLTNKKREVFDWLPIHNWSDKKVWDTIRKNGLPYHYAYDLGMPRLSCCFCIFSPFNALVIAGKANAELLDRYVEVENKIAHHFRKGMPIASVKAAIENGYVPDKISNWVM